MRTQIEITTHNKWWALYDPLNGPAEFRTLPKSENGSIFAIGSIDRQDVCSIGQLDKLETWASGKTWDLGKTLFAVLRSVFPGRFPACRADFSRYWIWASVIAATLCLFAEPICGEKTSVCVCACDGIKIESPFFAMGFFVWMKACYFWLEFRSGIRFTGLSIYARIFSFKYLCFSYVICILLNITFENLMYYIYYALYFVMF